MQLENNKLENNKESFIYKVAYNLCKCSVPNVLKERLDKVESVLITMIMLSIL